LVHSKLAKEGVALTAAQEAALQRVVPLSDLSPLFLSQLASLVS
jgi:hypothetical protein